MATDLCEFWVVAIVDAEGRKSVLLDGRKLVPEIRTFESVHDALEAAKAALFHELGQQGETRIFVPVMVRMEIAVGSSARESD